MATYKVPQDVEAEDKLIGPFSFRQFIYLVVASLGGFLAYGLSHIFWAVALLPVPIILFFLILALPLKKDQPMETYLTAIIRFLLKPHLRLWDPEGEVSAVMITALKVDEGPTLKNYSGQEASARLSYLSKIVDTGGWASRGLNSALDNISLSDTIIAEAQSAEDMLGDQGRVGQNIDTMITHSDQARKQAMMQSFQDSLKASTTMPAAASLPPAQPVYASPPPKPVQATAPAAAAEPAVQPAETPVVTYNPYPSSMHQRVIQPAPAVVDEPLVAAPVAQAQASSVEAPSPDIIRLATSTDLSISTIAREAERINKKHLEEEEVVVSLR